MCIIAYKPKGIATPNENILKTCFETNPHGAGFMVARNGMVEIHKGFMTEESMLKAVKNANIKKNEAAIFHFRISTAGSRIPANCHPFPLSRKTKELQTTNIKAAVGVAHNGIIPIEADQKNDMSDTMTFIRDLLARPAVFDNRKDLGIKFMIDEFVGNSKIIILTGDGEVEYFGVPAEDWITKNGMIYSNRSFNRAGAATADPRKQPANGKAFAWMQKSSNNFIGSTMEEMGYTERKPQTKTVQVREICPVCQRGALVQELDGEWSCAWCGPIEKMDS